MMAQRARARQCAAPVLWAGVALGVAHVPAAVTLVPVLAILRGPVGLALAGLAVAQAALRGTGPFVSSFETRASADRVAFTAAT